MSENIPETDPGLTDPEDRESYGEFEVDDENQLSMEDTLIDRGLVDALDEGYSPPERWSPAEGFGNTPAEGHRGESLEQRMAQEEPEPDPYALAADEYDEPVLGGEAGDRRAGRLVAEHDQGHDEDWQQDLLAQDVGIDGAGAGAEEAAVHVIEEPELD
ncbi:DUF5709 domain-containing protein [Nocardioides mesophilus]|uniref:DUF5709 domain-containing protein n=1 Tax=Nocardioides mesophilus TaxID=433659 RepID=A0A7G9REV3_9ACTN|nr:DUF5709 domain-containing protein [Nocardioides mesophilus]QNN54128.1 hypothetical protein H9L09_07080 [Nocardioides mesophilus]